MRNFEKFAAIGTGTGLSPVTGLTLVRAFAVAWLTAIAAVVVLPVILVFGIATGLARRVRPRKTGPEIIIEGDYRVLGPDHTNVR